MSVRAEPALVLACLAALAPLLPPVPAGAQEDAGSDVGAVRLDLREVERLALEHHPQLRAPAADAELARAQEQRARRARYLPEFRLRNVWGPIPRIRAEVNEAGLPISPDSTAAGPEDLRWFTDVDLSATQPLYTFGKAESLIDAAGARAEAAEASLAGERAEVLAQARRLYWGLVLGRQLLDVAEDVQERAEEAEETLRERFDDPDGGVTQNDMFKFRIFKYEIDKRHRQARDSVELARAALRSITGLEPGTPVRLEDEVLEPVDVELGDLSTYLEAALRSRPELRRLQSGIEARSELVEAEEADRWPQVFANAGFQWNVAPSRFDPENPFLSSGTNFFRPRLLVGFEWDLNFFRTGDEARVARLEEEKLRGQRGPLAQKVRQEVRRAYTELERSRANFEQSEEALQASENWLRSATQTFDVGIGELDDLIDAFRRNAEMRVEHLSNVFEYNASVAELSRVVGRDLIDGRNEP